MIVFIVAALALAVSIASCCIGLINWTRSKQNSRQIAAYLRVLELINQPPEPPPNGGRKGHLRIVAAWLPVIASGTWLLRHIRAHPAVASAAAFTTAAAVVTGLTITTPAAPPPAHVSLPPVHASSPATTDTTMPATTRRRRRPPVRTNTISTTRVAGDSDPPTTTGTPSATAATSTPTSSPPPPTGTALPEPICLIIGPGITLDLDACLAVLLPD